MQGAIANNRCVAESAERLEVVGIDRIEQGKTFWILDCRFWI
jgi:hypothetical protein